MSEKVAIVGLRGKAWNASRVRDLFVVFGPIQDVALPKEGSAVVTFKFAADAKEAVENMNGAEVEGAFIRVELAKSSGGGGELKIDSKYAVWGKSNSTVEEENDAEAATL